MKAAVLVVTGGVVAGCSETGFQDFIGAGKYAPDETQVSANQPLSMPPDLRLRPPSDEEPQVASLPQEDRPASGSLQQPQDLDASPQDRQDQQPAPQAQQPQSQPQPQPQPQQQADTGEPQDVYERWGVSRHHPDGTEKTQLELNAEMREKRDEMKRQEDPEYGTIWNLGSIWSDG